MPGTQADIQIVPGQQPGESDLLIKWTASRGYRLSLSADDSGSRSTGTYQGTMTLSLDNPSGLNYLASSQAVGSALSGKTVDINAGTDVNVLGSAIAGDSDVSLTALGNVNIGASTSTLTEQHHTKVKESGFLSGGGFGISYGTRVTTTDQSRDATTQSGQSRSMVGSIDGNLSVSAGNAINISGSDLSAGQDMTLTGKSVTITPGVDDEKGKFSTKTAQTGLTLAVGGSIVNAVQTAQGMSAAAAQTSGARLKALAAAAAGMTAKDTVDDLAKNGPSVKVSLTVGRSESESTEGTASRTHGGSVLSAGNNITISATGGGKASNVDIVGSDVRAAGNVTLVADNQVNLLAAEDTESQHSQSKSRSASVGMAAELSTSGGPKLGYTASVSASRGNVDGEGTTQVNSHVSAGNRLTLASGGDTNLRGAVASGNQVVVTVGGNLNIASLQDAAKFDGKRQSISASGTIDAGGGFSASASQNKVHNDYASVQEQSGLQVGEGGFQVNVAGHTDLKGGVISSSEWAIEDGRNSLATETLSFSDIENRESTEASGISLGVNVGKNQSGNKFSPSMAPGMGNVSDSQSSVTRSGVSEGTLTVRDMREGQAIAGLNRGVKTGDDTAQALTKSSRGAEALDDVGAQMEISGAAMPRLAKTIGDYAETMAAELNKLGNAEEAANWGEGGVYRVAAHTALGALGGGASGASGAASTAVTTPALASSISKLDVPEELKSALLLAAGTAIGVTVGGREGGVAGANEVANNYLSHVSSAFNKLSEQEQLVKAENECNAGNLNFCKTRDDLKWKSESRDIALAAACSHGQTADCRSAVASAQQAGNKVVFGSNGKVVAYPSGGAELVPIEEDRADSFHQKVSRSTSEGLLLYGTPTLTWKGAVQVPVLGARTVAAYQQASAGYSLVAAAGTGAVISGATYSGGAALGAYADVFSGRSTAFDTAFAQRFSYSGLAVATTVGAATGAYGTAMFQWAGVPNALSNLKTLPGAIIRLNSMVLGQSAGHAAKGAVTPPNKD